MKHISYSILILLFCSSAYGGSFSVGGQVIEVPSPKGFYQVTNKMDAVYRLAQQMVDPMNDQLAYYIAETDVPIAMSGEIPTLERYFILKVNKNIKNMVVGTKEFSEFKKITKQQNNEIFKSVEKIMPELLEKTSKGISKEFDVDIALKITQMVPLEPHHETNNSISYSMYINIGMVAKETKEDFIVSATATYINVAGKVLFLYSYGPRNDVEWTRSASKIWEESILSQNSAPPVSSSGGSSFNWSKVIEKAIVGAIVGGLFAIFFGLFSRFKKKG